MNNKDLKWETVAHAGDTQLSLRFLNVKNDVTLKFQTDAKLLNQISKLLFAKTKPRALRLSNITSRTQDPNASQRESVLSKRSDKRSEVGMIKDERVLPREGKGMRVGSAVNVAASRSLTASHTLSLPSAQIHTQTPL